jgi:FG-GAP-like repeat
MKITLLFLTLGVMTAAISGTRVAGIPAPLDFDVKVIPVGKAPGFIAVADVNHDGKPDLLVANTEDQTISVLLGDGQGNFTPAPGSPFPCGKGPNDIAVADMNGDGNPDLVIANTGTPYITVLLGDGLGGFQPSPHSPFSTQSNPHVHGVAVGNFMGDGKPAVVTDSWGRDEIWLIPSDGQGNLILPGKVFPADLHSDQGVRAADFNKDGNLDVVTTSQSAQGVGLLLGDGRGGFRRAAGSPFPAGAQTWAFTIDDVNRDGNPDVIVIPYHRDLRDPKQLGVTVLLGDGKGGFRTMPGSPLSLAGCRGPDRVGAGDLRGDGFRDIIVSCAQNDKIMLFMGSKDGTYHVATRQVQTGWSGIAVADLDGNGKDDIVVSNNSSGTVTIFFSK